MPGAAVSTAARIATLFLTATLFDGNALHLQKFRGVAEAIGIQCEGRSSGGFQFARYGIGALIVSEPHSSKRFDPGMMRFMVR
jgi:hypothetical protein